MEIEGRKLYYEVGGEGPFLVLAHAGFLDSGMWDGQWDAFAQHYRVIRYDMGGYGKSDPLQGPVSRRDELLRLLNHLGVKSAYLLGCSMAGEMMIDFTLEHPEMVLGLITVNSTPTGFEMQGEPPAEIMAMIEAMQKGDLKRTSELQIRLWIDGPFRQPQEVDPKVRQRAAEMNQIAVRNQTWAVADTQSIDELVPPAVEQLQNLHVPVLVMAGALDHPEVLRAAELMATGIQGAEKVILEGCAHVPSMEKPAEFNRIVLEFLGKH
ncbi:MAG: alpha/beta hydrolase [Caldilineaceae bacterium]|nr:alpha/beta hydrolase [Caldilineaceae bacterium]